ncbi:hypothetical protein [Agromyces larvae]|uniref:HNH endonuclease n=1 Tax=Agromyces larvae TaxID=2929802 RepID=A0ABY4C2Q8_9MICO|nr:hypothetical protein [Agromyces larvae]UOE45284.1 hypothetical protein MTO99_05835 [Agromyces larvae]
MTVDTSETVAIAPPEHYPQSEWIEDSDHEFYVPPELRAHYATVNPPAIYLEAFMRDGAVRPRTLTLDEAIERARAAGRSPRGDIFADGGRWLLIESTDMLKPVGSADSQSSLTPHGAEAVYVEIEERLPSYRIDVYLHEERLTLAAQRRDRLAAAARQRAANTCPACGEVSSLTTALSNAFAPQLYQLADRELVDLDRRTRVCRRCAHHVAAILFEREHASGGLSRRALVEAYLATLEGTDAP